ncbi:MAG: NHL repeat-containing protein [Planctomycetota bacterium]|jgi:hypothetical protein
MTTNTAAHHKLSRQPAAITAKALLGLSLILFLPACGGGGGGGGGSAAVSSGSLGSFGPDGEILSIDPSNSATRVVAGGAFGYREVRALARDSARDLFYLTDERSRLLRIDASGQVTQVGNIDGGVGDMAFDPDQGDLLAIRGSSRLLPTQILRIDPNNAEVTVVAETPGRFGALTYDRRMGRLISVARSAGGLPTNRIVSIDVQTGESTTLFEEVNVNRVVGLSIDPFTGKLHGATQEDPGTVLEYDLVTGFLEVTIYERLFSDLVIDRDSGRRFGLSRGSEVFELEATQTGTNGVARPIVTLERELYGFSFDPADGRFFAIDAPNHELVKFDPASGSISRVIPVELRSGVHREIKTLAYDPMRQRLFAVDRRYQEFLSIDPVTGEVDYLNVSMGSDTILAIDQASGRLFGYDQAVEVLIEIDPEAQQLSILDNAIGLTKVDDMSWDPVTQRLLAIHETPGRSGEPKLSSIPLSGTASPLPHSHIPSGYTAFGRDSITGLYHAFGAGRTRLEMELDIDQPSQFFQSVRSVDGAWRANMRTALTVRSRGLVYAVDRERLYEYDPRAQRMTLKGSLPDGLRVEDLIYDPATGMLGLCASEEISWVNPDLPWVIKNRLQVPGKNDLRITCDGNGRIFGVAEGVLYRVTWDPAPSLQPLTEQARSDFSVDALTYSNRGAVFALGREDPRGDALLLRFDVATGDWSDLGAVDGSPDVLFQF